MRFAPAASVAPSQIRAIADIAEDYPGTLRLFYGEDTLPTPDFIKDAGRRGDRRELHLLRPQRRLSRAPPRPSPSRSHRLHGVEVDPMREVVVTASGMVAINLACQATVGPGDSALVLTPLWPNIAAAIRVTGAEAIEVPFALAGRAMTCTSRSTSTASSRPSGPTPACSPWPARATRPPGPPRPTTGPASSPSASGTTSGSSPTASTSGSSSMAPSPRAR